MRRLSLVVLAVVSVSCSSPAPTPDDESTSEAADALFTETATCEAEVAGLLVQVTYPAAWFTADGCTRFDPDEQRVGGGDAAIRFGAVPSPPIQGREPTSGIVDGKPWIRVFERTEEEGGPVRHIVYYVTLDPVAGEPTLVAATSTAASGDHELNAAVLDRMIERLDVPG